MALVVELESEEALRVELSDALAVSLSPLVEFFSANELSSSSDWANLCYPAAFPNAFCCCLISCEIPYWCFILRLSYCYSMRSESS